MEQDAATRITVGIENLGEIVTRNITVPAVGFVSTSEVEQGVGEVLGKINTTLSTSGQEFLKDTLKRWRTRMKVTIHFADGPRFWSCDFAAPKPAFTPGEIDRSNFYLEVTAVDLHAVEHGLIWDQFVLTGYRCYQTLYRVREEGIIYPVVPSQFHREVEAELGSGSDVPNPFDVFMALWGPSNKLWLDRLTELSIASPTAGS